MRAHCVHGVVGALCLVLSAVTAPDAFAAAPMHDHELPEAFIELARDEGEGVALVELLVDWHELGGVLREDVLETLHRRYLEDLGARSNSVLLRAELPTEGFSWLRARGNKPGAWLPLNEFLEPLAPPPHRDTEETDRDLPPPPPPPAVLNGTPTTAAPAGALSGKTVYLSPGHGWTWSAGMKRWYTQRGNTHDIVEDFVNAEGALHYLVPLLHNAGATVVAAREMDMQAQMSIVDDGDGKVGGYVETGAWQKGSAQGFGNGKAPYLNGVNPFALGGYRAAKATKGKPTASARFTGNFPESGRYGVRIGYTANKNRVADAHVEIRHAGGITHRYVDMRKHGQTWHWLGDFYFRKGSDPNKGAVVLHNDTSADPTGKYVIADVVRFGGGMGEISRGNGAPPQSGKTTHRPRWESCARYYAQYAGAPKSVYDAASGSKDSSDDVGARARFAAWHHEGKDPAIYLSWHSNAPDGGRGTSTYVYGSGKPGEGAKFSGIKGSDTFAGLLQSNMVKDIRATFDPKWKDRGVKTAWFGELNPKSNPEMPAALVESAFHATKADADYLRRPRFRHLLSRSMYKSIVQYFAKVDGVTPKLLPEPPSAVRAWHNDATKHIQLAWKAGPSGGVYGDKASSWIIQRSLDGLAFDAGVTTSKASWKTAVEEVGKPVFFRVLAANEGGVSLPSSVVGVVPGCGPSQALVVQGFTRMSAAQLPSDDLSKWNLKKVQRLRQWKMNSADYLRFHLKRLAAANISADSAERDAFSVVDITGYGLIDWAAGEQSTEDIVWSATDRKKLADWLNGGAARALLASGSEIGWAVGAKGGKEAADWLSTWFGVSYAHDDAQTYKATFSAKSSKWAPQPVSLQLCDGGDQCAGAAYDVDWPDVFKLAGAKALLSYDGGKGGVGAALYAVGGAKTAIFGFPLESIRTSAHGLSVLAATASLLGAKTESFLCQSSSGDASSGDSDGGASGSVDAGGSLDGGVGEVDGGATTGDVTTTDTLVTEADSAGSSVDALDSGRAAGRVDAAGQRGALDGSSSFDSQGAGRGGDADAPGEDAGCGCDVRSRPRAPPGVWLVILFCAIALQRRRIADHVDEP